MLTLLGCLFLDRWKRQAEWIEKRRAEKREELGRDPRPDELPTMPKAEQNALRGSKYLCNGISGNDGRARYDSILRWLQQHLFQAVGDERTVQLIKERQKYLSSLVNGLVVQKREADLGCLSGFWNQKKKSEEKKRKRAPVEEEEDPFNLELTRQTFGYAFGGTAVVSDLSDGSMDGSNADSQSTAAAGDNADSQTRAI